MSLYGDIYMRYLAWGVKNVPCYAEPLFIFFFTLVITIAAGPQRRTIAANLHALLGKKSLLHDWSRVFRVFWNFAWTLADSARVRGGGEVLHWQLMGEQHFQAMKSVPGGLILLTAHLGSYDIAAPLFADAFGRKLHAVRIPERNASLQEYMKETRDVMQRENYQIHYNSEENLLGLKLAQVLGRGEVVAVQGDRVLPGISAKKISFHGFQWHLPRGPFVLAAAAGSPMFPVFITRTGWRRYQVEFFPKLEITRSTSLAEKRQEPDRILAAWANRLWGVLQTHWDQWVALEHAFEKEKAEETVS